MLTWDEIALEGGVPTEQSDIYTFAPVSRFDSSFKVPLARRRFDCLLHHDKWENSTALVINTISSSFSLRNISICKEISVDNGIQIGACSCRKHAHINKIKEPNLPEEVIIGETEELKTFFHNIFNGTTLGPGLSVIQKPLLDILQQSCFKPDLQSYFFLRWMRNLIRIALQYNIPIVEATSRDFSSDRKDTLNPSAALPEG